MALRLDAATHQTYEFTTNRQPEAGTAEPPGRRFISLSKGIKDSRHHCGRHADAGVTHRECD